LGYFRLLPNWKGDEPKEKKRGSGERERGKERKRACERENTAGADNDTNDKWQKETLL
jgi:hypothetical protein